MQTQAHLSTATMNKIVEEVSKGFGSALKALLEAKHLYQRVGNEMQEYWAKLQERYPADKYGHQISLFRQELEKEPLIPSTTLLSRVEGGGITTQLLTLILHNVKLYCFQCKSREAFAPVFIEEAGRVPKLTMPIRQEPAVKLPGGQQVFFFSYVCQHCKSGVVSLIVKRTAWSLALHGRSPMEQIESPIFIPKPEQQLYRDVLIAMHGGKVLAALFYLRTFIEQFARRLTGIAGKETGEVIMERYTGTLPANQRDSMPSLREWYGKLSEALHDAREDERLLEAAIEAIEHHFDIRRVHRIPETPAKA
jgi:hypothetical protein